ncbi:MAG: zf-HC2 domain-containing protein [Candidatus Eremiobacteraeota bacterium]|nr:zf-HC2 domain-containing protein [Candidatus Eremiobacteraeota bacterium]
MRCSFCELLLDRYVEGTLSRREMAAVTKHLATCNDCRALLEELKVVDGLLFTTRRPDLPPNFTFKVMSEARSVPAPRVPRRQFWSFLALYLASAWVLFVLWLATTGTNARAVGEALLVSAGRVNDTFAAVFSSAHAIGNSSTLFAFGSVALALDVAIATAAVFFFINVRSRLAARPAPVSEEAP